MLLQGPDGQPITPQAGQQLIIQTPNGQQQIIQGGIGNGTEAQTILGDSTDPNQQMLAAEGEQVYQTADGQIISAAAAQQLMGMNHIVK